MKMIHVLIIVYTFVISLNPLMKISSWASLDTNWRNALAESQPTAATAFADDDEFDTWQPVVQSQNWLITTASTAPLSLADTQHRESERFSVMIERQRQQPQPQQYLPNRYYAYNHHNGNYTKQQMAALSSASQLDQSVAKKTTTIKLKPYVVTTKDTNANANANNANPNYRRYANVKKHLPGREHQQQPYTPVHTSKGMTESANQGERLLVDGGKHFQADVNHQPPHPFPDNHRPIDSRLSHMPTAQAMSTTTDTFTVTNVNLIDTPATTTTSSPNKGDEANIEEILLPLHAALDKVKQFCDIVKDLITDDKDDEDYGLSINNNKDNDIDDESDGTSASEGSVNVGAVADNEDLSNEDRNDDNNNELTNSNFAPVLAAVKVLLMKKPITSKAPPAAPAYVLSKPMDEVQGHGRDIDKGRLKESLASSATSAPPSSSSSLPSSPPLLPSSALASAKSTSSEPINSRAFTVHQSSSTSSRALPLEMPRLRLPKLKFKKRKLKRKFKKKFKKFLFPLLIAYKLKFLALIPLLIGGLTLLVGSTGMAGFFFALFAAVMAMRSGHARSIVVKKY